MGFERLIRFEDDSGEIVYGNLPEELPAEKIEGSKVQIVTGGIKTGFEVTSETRVVKKLLCPIPDTPLVLCVGLNYHLHSKETSFPIPSQPVIFSSPADRLAGPLDDIKAHPFAQAELDYEGELTLVIGKDGKNIKEEEALDYVLGYTAGNDVSARHLLPTSISGTQMGYAKSFDTFAPIGPCITSTTLIPDPQALQLVTKVNGETRQDEHTSKMIWTVKQIIAHASIGRTLRQGTVLMTGTPNGVGWFTNGFIKHNDIVEVSISKIGSIRNKIAFE